MKTQNISLQLGFLLFISMITGCAQSTEKGSTPYNQPTASISTSNVSNLEISTPVLTPTIKNPSTPILMPAAISTLSTDHASTRLLDFLSNNGNCQLPCLWSITPGKSTAQEAQILWSPLSGISTRILTLPSYFTADEGSIHPAYIEDDLMLITNAGYESNHQVISHITFSTSEQKKFVPSTGGWGLLNIFGSTAFGKRVEYYSLKHLLSEQGIPTSVLILTSGLPPTYNGSGEFEIVLSYPNQGIWVRYTTQMQFLANGTVRGCPSNAHIEMDLYPSGNANEFSRFIGKTHPEISDGWYKPIQEVTSLTLQQFYETFQQPTDKCIETPAKLWPTPEP